jgi:hypothetical protein
LIERAQRSGHGYRKVHADHDQERHHRHRRVRGRVRGDEDLGVGAAPGHGGRHLRGLALLAHGSQPPGADPSGLHHAVRPAGRGWGPHRAPNGRRRATRLPPPARGGKDPDHTWTAGEPAQAGRRRPLQVRRLFPLRARHRRRAEWRTGRRNGGALGGSRPRWRGDRAGPRGGPGSIDAAERPQIRRRRSRRPDRADGVTLRTADTAGDRGRGTNLSRRSWRSRSRSPRRGEGCRPA